MAPFFSDSFTDTDGVTLQDHTPDTGTGWTRLWGSSGTLDLVIASNRLTQEAITNNGVIYTADATYPSADYEVVFTLVAVVTQNDRPWYIMVRLADQENMYAARLETTAGESSLWKKVAGTWTALGSLFTAPANGSVCKLRMVGNLLELEDDGVVIASANDSDLTAAGKAGLGAGGGAELVNGLDDTSTSNILDSFSITDLGVGAVYTPNSTLLFMDIG